MFAVDDHATIHICFVHMICDYKIMTCTQALPLLSTSLDVSLSRTVKNSALKPGFRLFAGGANVARFHVLSLEMISQHNSGTFCHSA